MKPVIGLFIIMAVIACLTISCNDRNSALIFDSSPDLTSTELASFTSEDLTDEDIDRILSEGEFDAFCKVTKPDGSTEVTLKKLVEWDGVSALKANAWYKFSNNEDCERAIALTPGLGEALKQTASKRNGKEKSDISAKLAYGSWSAECSDYRTGACYYRTDGTTSQPSDVNKYTLHALRIWWPGAIDLQTAVGTQYIDPTSQAYWVTQGFSNYCLDPYVIDSWSTVWRSNSAQGPWTLMADDSDVPSSYPCLSGSCIDQ